MSGGHFDYIQYRFTDIYEDIEKVISKNKYDYNYSKDVIEEFKKGVELLKKAQVYAQRIDWLLSDDDGEESFLQRLKDDLNKLEKK